MGIIGKMKNKVSEKAQQIQARRTAEEIDRAEKRAEAAENSVEEVLAVGIDKVDRQVQQEVSSDGKILETMKIFNNGVVFVINHETGEESLFVLLDKSVFVGSATAKESKTGCPLFDKFRKSVKDFEAGLEKSKKDPLAAYKALQGNHK
ncbi:hypothetical protein FACS1894186_8060 [Alphaproteobacteria bacterium]|nr:hypothetical protein FACS1894186_8060 [Alphaproteobacteria bacterium]